MENLTNEMKKTFDEFDKSGFVPAGGFEKKDFDDKSNEKIKAIQNLILLAEKNLRRKAFKVFDEFNVKFKYTSTDNLSLSSNVVNAINFSKDENKKDLQVAINFNFSKLGRLPAEEAYSVVYTTMYNSLLKNRASISAEGYEFGKTEDLQENFEEEKSATNDANFDREGNYISPLETNIKYLKKIISKLLGISEQESEASAKQIAKDFSSFDIKANDMFSEPEKIVTDKDMLVERYGMVAKKDNQQQATYLLGEISKESFEKIKSNDESQIKNFCLTYINSFLTSSGINPGDVNITFNPVGSMGEFNDFGGTSQTININLCEVNRINNPAEVVMILSHELTHAVDSMENKGKGITTKEGYGLVDNFVGSARKGIDSASNESSEVYDYLKHLHEVCYRVNPNERSARIGEIVALKFMQGMQPDQQMQKYINKSIESYQRYQNKVFAAIDEVSSIEKIQALEDEYNSLKSSILNASTKTLIEDRLRYLKSLLEKQKLDSINDEKALQEALQIKQELNGEKQQVIQSPEVQMGE